MDKDVFEITHKINEDGMTVAQLSIELDKYKALADRYEKVLIEVKSHLNPSGAAGAVLVRDAYIYRVILKALQGTEKK